MDPVALLAELRALADNIPNFDTFTPSSRVHQEWIGKLHALIEQWKPSEEFSLGMQISWIGIDATRASSVSKIISTLHRAIADLEHRLPPGPHRVFGPGAVYDFFKALRDLLLSAEQSVLIVDPYIDEQVFDTYLAAVKPQVSIRLLTKKGAIAMAAAVAKFTAQTKMKVEARTSQEFHDRVLFLDDSSGWVLGQSIKDAARSKPTYIAPLDSETARLKKAIYEQIWLAGKPL
jgi:hypothetical protein